VAFWKSPQPVGRVRLEGVRSAEPPMSSGRTGAEWQTNTHAHTHTHTHALCPQQCPSCARKEPRPGQQRNSSAGMRQAPAGHSRCCCCCTRALTQLIQRELAPLARGIGRVSAGVGAEGRLPVCRHLPRSAARELGSLHGELRLPCRRQGAGATFSHTSYLRQKSSGKGTELSVNRPGRAAYDQHLTL
jgi:hypothetical protein